jgi:hypothetical protein
MKGINKPSARGRLSSRLALATLAATALTVGLAGHVSAATLVASSPFFAGYYAAPAEGIASVSATFNVPTINCADDNANTQYLGINVDNEGLSDVQATCDGGGTASYAFYLEWDGGTAYTGAGVYPGDTVVVSIFQTTTRQEAELHNVTTGGYAFDYGPPTGALPWVYIGGINDEATPPFTTIAFTKCQINGLYLSEEGPTQYNEKFGNVTLVTASKLAKPGDNFKLTFKNEAY